MKRFLPLLILTHLIIIFVFTSWELNAQATVDNQILITSNQTSPSPGDWYGLSFFVLLTPASFVNEEYTSGSINE